MRKNHELRRSAAKGQKCSCEAVPTLWPTMKSSQGERKPDVENDANRHTEAYPADNRISRHSQKVPSDRVMQDARSDAAQRDEKSKLKR